MLLEDWVDEQVRGAYAVKPYPKPLKDLSLGCYELEAAASENMI